MALRLDLLPTCLFLIAVSWLVSSLLPVVTKLVGAAEVSQTTMFLTMAACLTGLAILRTHIKIKADGKAVLITGCDTGFGFHVAKRLHQQGFLVFAGCLLKDHDGAGARELQDVDPSRLHVVQMDVTSEQQVKNALEYVRKTLSDGTTGLWGLVNNAGLSTFGEVEWTTLDVYQKIADINLWGMIRVTRTFLPLLRTEKGRVINVASVLGRMSVPSRSAYCVSKYGVEGFSDCLRYEMRRWGVHVSLIEPGNYISGTNIFTAESVRQHGEQMWASMSEEVRSDYGRRYFDSRLSHMKKSTTYGSCDISPVVDAITDSLLETFPLPRYQPMNLYFAVRTFIQTHLPEFLYELLYVKNVES